MAGDPLFHGGAWTADACNKIIRFVDMAQTFHLPIVHLVDCPGFQVGLAAEKQRGHPLGRARAVRDQPDHRAVVQHRRAQLLRRRRAGHQPVSHLCVRYAWPSASWGSLPLEGGIEAAYRAEIDAAPDPQAKMDEIEARLNRLRSPLPHRRAVLGRGGDRPARDAAAAVRVRQHGGAIADAGESRVHHAALMPAAIHQADQKPSRITSRAK